MADPRALNAPKAQNGLDAALAASAPSPLRITVPAPCYAGTQQEASHAGDPDDAPVEKLLAPPPVSISVTRSLIAGTPSSAKVSGLDRLVTIRLAATHCLGGSF